jgi:probable rRNA maturation factor
VTRFRIHTRTEVTQRDYSDLLRTAARQTLAQQKADPGEVTIVLTDTEHMRSLNRQFMGLDRGTDVLAFPHGEIDPDNARNYLGDVIISLHQAEQQAEQMGHSLEKELALLCIHGTLHLLGYDDSEPPGQEEMQMIQRGILASLKDDLTAVEAR